MGMEEQLIDWVEHGVQDVLEDLDGCRVTITHHRFRGNFLYARSLMPCPWRIPIISEIGQGHGGRMKQRG
jgi:hypothetical protein